MHVSCQSGKAAQGEKRVIGSVVRNCLVLVGISAAALAALHEYTPLFDPAMRGIWAPASGGRPATGGTATASYPSEANQMVIEAAPDGHFMVSARIGGRDVEFVVDTGASMVALSPGHAERLGYAIHQLDFAGRAQTPNGIARFAPIVLEEIAIGEIVVRDVPAAVLEKPMEKSLLGMTFLRRLAGFEVKGDRLILRW